MTLSPKNTESDSNVISLADVRGKREDEAVVERVRESMEERFDRPFATKESLQAIVNKSQEDVNAPVIGLDKWENYHFLGDNLIPFGVMQFFSTHVDFSDETEFWWPMINGRTSATLGEDKLPITFMGDFHPKNKKNNCRVTTPNYYNGQFSTLPIINSQLIRKIRGRYILDCNNVRNVHDRLNASVKLDSIIKRGQYPVFNGNLVTHIGGMEIKIFEEMENIRNSINGVVRFLNYLSHCSLPVINGEPIEKIDDVRITGAKSIKNIDGKMNGLVLDKYTRAVFPVLAGEVIKEIDGYQVLGFDDFENIGGKLNGRIRINDRNQFLPVIDGKVLEEVDGCEVQTCGNIRNMGGLVNGEFIFKGNSDRLPVINGKLVYEIEGKEIYHCKNSHNIDGTYNGQVWLLDDYFNGDQSGTEFRDVILSKFSS